MSHQNRTFRANGYTAKWITKGLEQTKSSHPAQEVTTDKERQELLYLPYVQHTSEHMQWVCRQIGVKVVFKLKGTLRETLMKVKNPRLQMLTKCILYNFACKDYDNLRCTLGRQEGTYRKDWWNTKW